MKIAGARDELESLFPFHAPPAEPARPSRQAEALLARLKANTGTLEAAGIRFGRSRLALRTEGEDHACRYVGLCLSGCPYSAVWTATQLLESLMKRPNFTYRPGLKAVRVESSGARARVICRSLNDDGNISFIGERVFLACGPISTARLVIDSLVAYGRPFRLQFQPYFLLPLLALENTAGVSRERLHTLAQIYLDILDPKISPRAVHLQIYTYDEFIRQRLERAIRPLGPLRGLTRSLFEGRLLFLQGYLHSDEAEPIELKALPAPSGEACALSLHARDQPRTRTAIRRVLFKLAANGRRLGVLPLAPMLALGIPGEGNHIGGTFPMRENPGGFETDILGRLPGLPGVHIVDSSVLPALAATTFTYTAMANAHRIAWTVAA